MRRIAALLASTAALALAFAPAALADGNPASDVLLAQDVFLPYAPNTVSKPVAEALETTLQRARAKGFPVKVALIADRRDLGSVGQLLGEPQQYADLLTTEISLNVPHGRAVAKPRVLTVLPSGLGGNNLGDTAGDALTGVLPSEAEGADGLARTAAVAVGKLAAAAGKPIAMPTLPAAGGGGGGGGIPSALLFGGPVLLLAFAIMAVNLRMGKHPPAVEEPVAG